jgi:endonuclease/exonuclease/phosphatase family metal-dependent hydrolase
MLTGTILRNGLRLQMRCLPGLPARGSLQKLRRKRYSRLKFSLLFLNRLALTGFLVSVTATASHGMDPELSECKVPPGQDILTAPLLSVLTLNLAHGRKDGFNQMLQKASTTRRNLEKIAGFLSNSGADLVALQEADAPSKWSGKFNHVDFVSELTPYPCRIHGHHAQKSLYDFGTALLSRVPYTDSLSHTFAPSPPTTNKGFVMGKVLWNPDGQLQEPIAISVISVHLDFSRKKVREAQVEEMRAMLPDVERPVIILGDFNTDWTSDGSALKTIAENGGFKVYRPESTELGTYKKGKHRLDWILISDDLEFASYEVPQLVLSDHQPVFARVRLLQNTRQESENNDQD